MKVRTNIYLTQPQKDKLEKLSKKTGLATAEIIRRAIDAYLQKEK
jgi:predicted DNA-binding protein